MDYNNFKNSVSKAFVIAYLIQEIPRYIIKHIYDVLPIATDIANSDINDDLLNCNNTNPLKHVIHGSNVNEIGGDITLKSIENVDLKNVTNKDSIKFIINKNLVQNKILR